MLIQIRVELDSEDQDEFYGCDVVDYCPEDHVVWLRADTTVIDAEYTVNGGLYPDEAWGQVAMVEELDLTIKHCRFFGYDILNDEEICWMLFDEEKYDA